MEWTEVESRDLKDNSIGAAGMMVMASGEQWTQLRYLYLSSNFIGDEGLLVLVPAAPHWNRLEELHLRNTGISADGVIELACKAALHWKGLKVLSLSCNPDIGDRGIIPLAFLAAPHWLLLEDLWLENTGMAPAGLRALAAAAHHWEFVKKVNIDNRHVKPRDILGLCKVAAPYWNQLEKLYCRRPIGAGSLEEVAARSRRATGISRFFSCVQ